MMIRNIIESIRKSEYMSFLFRVIIGGLFLYSGAGKVPFPGEFALIIHNYQIIPDVWINLVAIILPWLEIYCGIFLLIGLFPRASALVISFILLIFILALVSAVLRGLDINCGCYGSDTPVDLQKIGEDVLLFLLSLHLVFLPSGRLSVNQLFKRLT